MEAKIERIDTEALEMLYTFRGRPEVMKFLENNPFLPSILQEAHQQIRIHFGNAVRILLEVVADPEVEEEQELVIFIRVNVLPEEAFKKLERFDKKWWLDAPVNARKKLGIDMEFE